MGGRCWNKPHKALGKGLVAARQFCPIGEELLACFRSFDVIGCEDLNGGHFGKLHILRYLNIAAAGPPEGQLQLSKPSDLSVFVAKYKESDWRPSLNPAPSAPFLDRHLEGAHLLRRSVWPPQLHAVSQGPDGTENNKIPPPSKGNHNGLTASLDLLRMRGEFRIR